MQSCLSLSETSHFKSGQDTHSVNFFRYRLTFSRSHYKYVSFSNGACTYFEAKRDRCIVLISSGCLHAGINYTFPQFVTFKQLSLHAITIIEREEVSDW